MSAERWPEETWPGLARRCLDECGGLVSLTGIAERWGLSKSTVHVHTRNETFPTPVYVGRGEKLWLRVEVDEWRARR